MLTGQEKGALTQLNLAVVGHVDSGKSTLSGRLLHQLGRISRKDMHKYEKESKERVYFTSLSSLSLYIDLTTYSYITGKVWIYFFYLSLPSLVLSLLRG